VIASITFRARGAGRRVGAFCPARGAARIMSILPTARLA